MQRPEGDALKHQAVPSTSSHTVLIPRTAKTIPCTGEREVRKVTTARCQSLPQDAVQYWGTLATDLMGRDTG